MTETPLDEARRELEDAEAAYQDGEGENTAELLGLAKRRVRDETRAEEWRNALTDPTDTGGFDAN